jgi:hypothetical protein
MPRSATNEFIIMSGHLLLVPDSCEGDAHDALEFNLDEFRENAALCQKRAQVTVERALMEIAADPAAVSFVFVPVRQVADHRRA